MDAVAPRRRPGLVTFVVVLIYIAGIAEVLVGIGAIFVRYLPEAQADGVAFPVTVLGAAMIIIGLAVVSVASGVARGSRFGRAAITILLLLGLVIDVVALVLDPDSGPSGLIAQAIACVIVALPLWIGPGGRFFARPRA
ncbi:DUF7144 family membrane protein [Herbiconiux ginsengi]|uniref:DUF7144 domain-containing protein n=1 Tax=Herbiconiux ginsengi TaxID=381665 RepID=A0A1H3PGG9_9MICO|nr:hypothetical protein [Herbiconiux ginsengi]SDZ00220.1 hypothetical protein SAMN05216554_1881 [Herbiconiux ginsengi]